MVLGFERINERVRTPNKYINFIKPLEGPDKAIAQDYLERIAAIVFPIMRDNHLSVMSLEEHEPNKEFWGRNFNFGEIIQLVLKSHEGLWLPILHVQLVMIHELAHVKEMNHGRYFHRLRLSMQSELQTLKSKGYTGEGFWAAGCSLHPSASVVQENRPLFESEITLDLCGGFYKRASGRGRRRRRRQGGAGGNEEREKIPYAERKRRRIVKKFGSEEGISLGSDVEKRAVLDNSAYGGSGSSKPTKGSMAKPRVAQSNRGRELRLQAALARFGGGASSISPVAPKQEPIKKYLKNEDNFIDLVDDDDEDKKPTTSEKPVIDIDEEETESEYESDGEQGEVTYVKAEDKSEEEDKELLEKEFSELSCQPPRPKERRGKPVINLDEEPIRHDDVVITRPPAPPPKSPAIATATSSDKIEKSNINVSEDEIPSPNTLVGDEEPLATKESQDSIISLDDEDLPDDDLDVYPTKRRKKTPPRPADLMDEDEYPEDDLDVYKRNSPILTKGSLPKNGGQISSSPGNPIDLDESDDDDDDDDLYAEPPKKQNITTTSTTKEEAVDTKRTPQKPISTLNPALTKSPPAAPRSSTSLFDGLAKPPSVTILSQPTPQPLRPPQVHAPPKSFSMNRPPPPPPPAKEIQCKACSTPNDSHATLCLMCSNVISDTLPSWRCKSAICANGDGSYKNSMDCGVCGVCGERRP